MSDIAQIDANLRAQNLLGVKDAVFYDAAKPPFALYGLSEPYTRLPDDIGQNVSEGVAMLYRHTAGGRLRFLTDSPYIIVRCRVPSVTRFAHMPLTGTTGFDCYIDKGGRSTYHRTFVPPPNCDEGYDAIVQFSDAHPREVTLHFPLYNAVDALEIGLREGATLGQGAKYRALAPVVYYGSSITQGGCASRPGNAYSAIIARKTNVDFVNLGFSGNARGEQAMAAYIASLAMSAFVLDYDYNAPTVEHLKETHGAFFQAVRSRQPKLPVLMVSKPDFENDAAQAVQRRAIIHETFLSAVRSGDENVYFIDGQSLFHGENRDSCTVDACHPNDAGFLRMADVIGKTVERMLFG